LAAKLGSPPVAGGWLWPVSGGGGGRLSCFGANWGGVLRFEG